MSFKTCLLIFCEESLRIPLTIHSTCFRSLFESNSLRSASLSSYSAYASSRHFGSIRFSSICTLSHSHVCFPAIHPLKAYPSRPRNIAFSPSRSKKTSPRSYRRRVNKRLRLANKPVLDEALFTKAVSQLPPRFTADDLHDVIILQDDPLVCQELFNWASQQPRFRHNVNTYHATIHKLGAAELYEEMDKVVNQVLAVPHVGSEALYNTMVYYFTKARKLTRAVNIFNHMRNSRNLDCQPSIRTYNILFAAFVSRGKNTYVNYLYMDTMSCLFRQLVNDGIEPDIFTLNTMIKGYVLSNHVNDALRIFHQMGVVYSCTPDAVSYDFLIHGLCVQSRTNNARELLIEMEGKGFVLSSRSYNSLVSALSLNGEIKEAVKYIWEMAEKRKSVDYITYQTLLDEICRRGSVGEAFRFLEEFRVKDLVDGPSYQKLLCFLEDDLASAGS